jgi:transcriptional regulator with XRE-family HTH domain
MKSIYTDEYKFFLNWLTKKRNESRLTQQELSKKLGKPQSYVSKYENGERRLDIVEFLQITLAINADPFEVIQLLKERMQG